MIVQLTGTLVEVTPSRVVLDVAGVGYELGVSSTTASELPHAGESGVTVLARMQVREDAIALFGFATREERALFDHLVAVGGVGPKLALSVLSTFSPAQLVDVVAAQDASRLATVPGVGKKLASRMLLELKGVFAKDEELAALAGVALAPGSPAGPPASSTDRDVVSALLSMGFTPQEAALALEGHEEAGASTLEAALGYALRRLGKGA